jgi:hypothetical protein
MGSGEESPSLSFFCGNPILGGLYNEQEECERC